MVTIIKSEWHQVEKRYGLDIDEEILQQIYPDFTEVEISEVLDQLKSGEIDVDTLLEDADSNGVPLDFDWLDEDDWWTDRKGGYEVTYEVTESDTSVSEDDEEEVEAELLCHNCSWEGNRDIAIIEDNLLMCPECNSPVGHVDVSDDAESLDELRNQLYNMMKGNDV
jgi:hypothetical protein